MILHFDFATGTKYSENDPGLWLEVGTVIRSTALTLAFCTDENKTAGETKQFGTVLLRSFGS